MKPKKPEGKWRPRSKVLLAAGAAFPQAEYDERLPWHFLMTGRPAWSRLLRATSAIAKVAKSSTLVLCPGAESSWINVPRRMQRSAVEVTSPSEALDFVRRNSHYRSEFFGDYYLMDTSFSWLTKFCHDDDWHAFLPEKIACSPELKRAYFALRFRSMPPWPIADLYD